MPLSLSRSLIIQVQAEKQTLPFPLTLQYPQHHPPDLETARSHNKPHSSIGKRRKRKMVLWNPT